MKHLLRFFSIGLGAVILLAACAPKAAPPTFTPIVIVVTATSQPATDTPAPAPSPTDTPTLEPIVLAGPEMKIGSTYLYVDGALLVAVPGGEFIMGRGGGTDNPEHKVTLPDFWIYRTEVTNEQYRRCVAAGQCSPPDLQDNVGYDAYVRLGDYTRRNEPVSGVTWSQADAYCRYVHGRLPTEAEWEKTARGPDGNIYPWGNNAPSCNLLNFNNCVAKATDVNTYPQGKSYYGAYDMAGNVFEWVADWYDPLYYRSGPAENPLGPESGQRRSVRSSGYRSNPDQVPAAVRFFEYPTTHRRDLGFRCVVEDPTYFAPFCEQIAYVGANVGGGPLPQSLPTPSCPTVSISSSAYCNNNVPGGQPAANLQIGPHPSGTLIEVPASCSVVAPEALYYCTAGGEASVQAPCTVPPAPAPAGCGPDYAPDPSDPQHCIYTGRATLGKECLPGYTYDAARQCCSTTPGSDTSYDLCPVDAPYYDGSHCVPWPSAEYGPKKVLSFDVGVCQPGGGPCDPKKDPNCPGGQCPPGTEWVCVPNPGCGQFPTGQCPYPDVCSCQ